MWPRKARWPALAGAGQLPAKGLYPIKLKDAMLQTSIAYLQKIGVFPDKDDSSDEMVFGDDDFPS